jgi:hypothetical protein
MGVKHGSVILSEEYRLRVSEPRRLGFAPGSVHVGFVVDRVAVGLGFLRVSIFLCQCHSTVSLHTYVPPGGVTIGPLFRDIISHPST